ncbi:MAG: hypothetical protein OQK74_00115 [Gammaproteobacteria bacterium]|jgi:hypothetical protein|nr:hypothetical protein [Gammaproteobacteria bacterium]
MNIKKKFMASAVAMTLSLGIFSGGMSAASDGERPEPTGEKCLPTH